MGSLEGLSEILALSTDADRQRYFDELSEAQYPGLVGPLCDQVNRLVRTDLDLAERVVDTAGWLARKSGDPSAKGRHLRAAGNIRWGKRDYRGAVALCEQALVQLKEAGDDREVVRTLSSGMGFLTHLGEFEKGERWGAEARKICGSLDETLLAARLEFNSGHALAHQDRYHEALDRYQSAYRFFLEGGEPTDVASALRNIAVTHQQLNNHDAALMTYQEAAKFCRQHGLHGLLLEVEYNAAYLFYLRGNYESSLKLFDEARVRSEAAGDRHHMALCDLDQAEIYLELNLIADAATMSERAFEQFDELGLPLEAAQALTYQGIAASRSGSREKSLTLLGRARDRFVAQDNRFRVGTVDLCRAQVMREMGRSRESQDLANSAYAIFSDIGLPTKTAHCELVLARLALDRGNATDARKRCASALSIVEGIDVPWLEYQAQILDGLAAETLGDEDTALRSFRAAHETLERIRGHLHADDLKIGLSMDQQAAYEGLVTLLLARGGEADQGEVFDVIQRAKSRSLGDLLATRVNELAPSHSTDEALATDINKLRSESNWFHRQIEIEESKGKERSAERLDELRKRSRTTEDELLRRSRQLALADPDLSTLSGSFSTNLDTLRAHLPAGTQLLEYFMARGVVYACLIDSDRLVMRHLCETKKLQRDLMLLRTQFGKLASGHEPTPKLQEFNQQTTSTLLEDLHDRLIAPLRDHLDGRHLVIAPNGFLHGLPFHALRTGDAYLIDERSISYAPSATVFELCSRRYSANRAASLVLGVPDERAPLIEEEARTVAAILPNSRLLLRGDATLEHLVRYGTDCRLLHIATHGILRRDNPMFSSIRLGDSRLSVFDLYKLRLNADLVVLSGCSTGLSSVQGSDELVGLTRGLLYAGARTVMVSLWDVNDQSTNRFMAAFYKHLAKTALPAEALRRSQCEMRMEYQHPYHWAPFILVGRVEPPAPSA